MREVNSLDKFDVHYQVILIRNTHAPEGAGYKFARQTYVRHKFLRKFGAHLGDSMKITDLRSLLKDKRVVEEINKHLWIESQKAGYSIGIERATDEWLRLYAIDWMKYHAPEKYTKIQNRDKKDKQVTAKNKAATKKIKRVVKKSAKK